MRYTNSCVRAALRLPAHSCAKRLSLDELAICCISSQQSAVLGCDGQSFASGKTLPRLPCLIDRQLVRGNRTPTDDHLPLIYD